MQESSPSSHGLLRAFAWAVLLFAPDVAGAQSAGTEILGSEELQLILWLRWPGRSTNHIRNFLVRVNPDDMDIRVLDPEDSEYLISEGLADTCHIMEVQNSLLEPI